MKLNRMASLGFMTAFLTSAVVACGSKDKVTAPSSALVGDAAQVNGAADSRTENRAPAVSSTIADVAVATPELSTLVSLLKLCDLVEFVGKNDASLTVFAPSNAAFAKFLKGQPAPTKCDDSVKKILVYHVVGARVVAGDLKAQQAFPTFLGPSLGTGDTGPNEVFVTKSNSGVTINGGSKVVLADVAASNGVVHVVDTVLIPDSFGTVVDAAVKRYNLTTLVSAVVGANLADALSNTKNITVFAPVNAAFGKLAALPAGDSLVRVLKEHVVGSFILAKDLNKGNNFATSLNGNQISINIAAGATIRGSGDAHAQPANIIETDIVANNGVIHLIDSVLTPKTH